MVEITGNIAILESAMNDTIGTKIRIKSKPGVRVALALPTASLAFSSKSQPAEAAASF